MKKIIILSFFCLTIVTFYSCDKCRYLDCYFGDTSGRFRIISKINGNDLVFGNNSIYDKSKLKFFSLNGNDTSFFQYDYEPSSSNFRDSILKV